MSATIYQLLFRTATISAAAYWLVSASGSLMPAPTPAHEVLVPVLPVPVDTTGSDTLGNDLKKSGQKAIIRWQDYYQNRFSEPRPRSSLYLKDPVNIKTSIELDSTGRVVVEEDVTTPKGTLDYRPTQSLDLNTYNEMQRKRAFETLMREYSARLDGKSAMGGRGLLPKLDLPPALDKLFGENFMDFKPNGFVALDFGVLHQFIDNPAVPVRQRRNTSFIFNEQININFNAKMGDRMGFLTNFDTKAI